MIRILLPLAVIAAILFGPMFNEPMSGPKSGDTMVAHTGNYYVGNTVECWKDKNFSIEGECEPTDGLEGKAIFGAVLVSGVAAALGIFGLLPFVGRVTSIVTMISGLVTLGAMGFFAMNMMSSEIGIAGVQWGAYLAGGGGLLTLISGLAGMRGE